MSYSMTDNANTDGDLDRLRLLEISADAFVEVLQEKRVVDEALPDGVDIHRAGYDQERDVFYLVVAHEDYRPVHEAESIPWADVSLQKI